MRTIRSKTERRGEASQRAAETAKLSPEERLARLDSRLGVGVGAKKERARLEKMV